jgi:hypothetical protein
MIKIINENGKEDWDEFQLCYVCMFVSFSSIELISILQGSYSTDLFV